MKCIMVGDSGTGKTSFIKRVFHHKFEESYMSTIGVDFERKTFSRSKDGTPIEFDLQIWDTAGRERFRTITRAYYRGTHAFFILYDVTQPDSFERVPEYIQEIHTSATNTHYSCFLFGNKIDLKEKRAISTEKGQALATSLNLPFFEVSIKEDTNISQAFESILDTLAGYVPEEATPDQTEPSPSLLGSIWSWFSSLVA
uniref:Uncharacterized protein n=1 Tax=Arcella intermedia TaxID=1963864 RepID=A0A6B2LIU0_9EUKA